LTILKKQHWETAIFEYLNSGLRKLKASRLNIDHHGKEAIAAVRKYRMPGQNPFCVAASPSEIPPSVITNPFPSDISLEP
jgi:hypothetical protein